MMLNNKHHSTERVWMSCLANKKNKTNKLAPYKWRNFIQCLLWVFRILNEIDKFDTIFIFISHVCHVLCAVFVFRFYAVSPNYLCKSVLKSFIWQWLKHDEHSRIHTQNDNEFHLFMHKMYTPTNCIAITICIVMELNGGLQKRNTHQLQLQLQLIRKCCLRGRMCSC